MRASMRAISSSLCKVAFDTTTPPTVTGLSRATGASLPVRPDLDIDIFQHGFGLFGGEFVGDGPARRTRDKTQPVLQFQPSTL